MALITDISKIKDKDTVCLETREDGKQYYKPATEGLFFATMSVGLPTIEEKNIPEWLFRLKFLESTGLKLFTPKDDDPMEVVRLLKAHIGLKTNASKETKAAFIKRNVSHITSEAEYRTNVLVNRAVELGVL